MSRLEALDRIRSCSRLSVSQSATVAEKLKQEALRLKDEFEIPFGEFLMLWTEEKRANHQARTWRKNKYRRISKKAKI